MSTDGDGIYVSARQRRRRRRRIGTAAAGVALVLGAGGYATTTWYLGRQSTVAGTAPVVTASGVLRPTPFVAPQSAPAEGAPGSAGVGLPGAAPAVPSAAPGAPSGAGTAGSAGSAGSPGAGSAGSPGGAPAGPPAGTISAARRSWLPSPVPSPSAPTDDELAATQVGRLLQPRPGGVAAADTGATVRNEITPGGMQARVVSARYDLSDRWKLLGAADTGQRVGAARCTQNFRVDGAPLPQNRPGLLLCWRLSPAKSVIVVGTRSSGRPVPAEGEVVIAREWASMG